MGNARTLLAPAPCVKRKTDMNVKALKKVAIPLLVLCFIAIKAAQAGDVPADKTLVWCGLDYSKVKMIGSMDFRRPEQIFPARLADWNGLFMKEMLPKVEGITKSLRTDLSAVQARNEKATSKQIEREDGSREEKVLSTHITETDIAATIRSYELKQRQGLGLVFIMDRLVKLQETGCLFVVFFDIDSREVLLSQRVCAEADGSSFRSHWFNPIKIAVKKLPKMYKSVIAEK